MTQRRQALTIRIRIDGVRETLAAFRQMPKEASDALRERSKELAQTIADRVKAAGQAEGAQAAKLARTVRAQRDRVPVIAVGGTRKIGRQGEPAYSMVFASEFGMNRRTGWYAAERYDDDAGASQYPPHRGRQGYWIFPTVERSEGEISDAWNRVADDILDQFGRRV